MALPCLPNPKPLRWVHLADWELPLCCPFLDEGDYVRGSESKSARELSSYNLSSCVFTERMTQFLPPCFDHWFKCGERYTTSILETLLTSEVWHSTLNFRTRLEKGPLLTRGCSPTEKICMPHSSVSWHHLPLPMDRSLFLLFLLQFLSKSCSAELMPGKTSPKIALSFFFFLSPKIALPLFLVRRYGAERWLTQSRKAL